MANVNIKKLARLMVGAANCHSVNFIQNSNKPPELAGEGSYHTTPGGKLVRFPNAYGYRTIYHPSTLNVIVGENWQPKIPKNMKLKEIRGKFVIIRKSDGMDLHIHPKDLIRKNFCTWVRKKMANNYCKRLETNKLQRILESYLNKNNTYVTLEDARRAGNCMQGIKDWVKRKLNADFDNILSCPWLAQFPAKLIYRLDKENNLVKNTIRQAILRETTISI